MRAAVIVVLVFLALACACRAGFEYATVDSSSPAVEDGGTTGPGVDAARADAAMADAATVDAAGLVDAGIDAPPTSTDASPPPMDCTDPVECEDACPGECLARCEYANNGCVEQLDCNYVAPDCTPECGDDCIMQCSSVQDCLGVCGARCTVSCQSLYRCQPTVGPGSEVTCHGGVDNCDPICIADCVVFHANASTPQCQGGGGPMSCEAGVTACEMCP